MGAEGPAEVGPSAVVRCMGRARRAGGRRPVGRSRLGEEGERRGRRSRTLCERCVGGRKRLRVRMTEGEGGFYVEGGKQSMKTAFRPEPNSISTHAEHIRIMWSRLLQASNKPCAAATSGPVRLGSDYHLPLTVPKAVYALDLIRNLCDKTRRQQAPSVVVSRPSPSGLSDMQVHMFPGTYSQAQSARVQYHGTPDRPAPHKLDELITSYADTILTPHSPGDK